MILLGDRITARLRRAGRQAQTHSILGITPSAPRSPKNRASCADNFTSLHLMPPSLQKLALTLAALAIGTTEGLRFQKRADTSNAEGPQNVLITDAEQSLFYTPMQFGSGSGLVSLFGLVSTTR